MRFCWYPLRDNFMVQDAYGDVRRDKAVFGSRRVYSVWKSAYICTHIFCIREEELYEAYQESVVETKGEIYILDEKGNLISSSNQECVQRGAVDDVFRKKILNRTEDDFTWKTRTENFEICVRQSELNKWMTVAVIPQKNITGEVNALYLRIYVVLILCLIGCVVILLRMYQGFFTPVNELNQAMCEVQMGNLNAYVKETGRNEIADMMRYYNNMLRSIHVHVVEKLESERRKKELELEVLVSQINPHFLYNTLDTIVWLIEGDDPDKAVDVVVALSEFFRLVLSKGKEYITIREEEQHIQGYLEIQQARYQDILDYEIRIDPVLYRYKILKLTLQPLVENSLYHGIKYKRAKGKIRITGKLEQGDGADTILLCVEDNGVGMEEDELKRLQTEISKPCKETEKGFGLANVNERIRMNFGMEYGMKIESKKGCGTKVEIVIPAVEFLGETSGEPLRESAAAG